ncbi:MAG: helicase c2 [Bacteroidetes bacterium]|nr:helicase c2 [Bacteroidota bacterium]
MIDLPSRAAKIFSPSGALALQKGYEHRPQQEVMATSIAEALCARQHLIIEAPTGIGKTLAYLVPSILHATEENRKAIISTHTKNLQEQIFYKDIALAKKITGKDCSVVLLKGRRNYLCTTRLRNAMASTSSMFGEDAATELERIHAWSLTTVDGDMESLGFVPSPELWSMVCSEKEVCSSRICKQDCFFQMVKDRVKSARVVIMNHALFFALMALQETDEQYLFDNDFVVFDEAHTLEGIAGAGLGKTLSSTQVLWALHRLYNPRTKRGLLAKQGPRLKKLCHEVERAAVGFFEEIQRAAMALRSPGARGPGAEVRIRSAGLVTNSLHGLLLQLQSEVKRAEDTIERELTRQELAAVRRSLWEADVLIDEFLDQHDAGFTYWVETGEKKVDSVKLCATPTDISTKIGQKLFRDGSSVIMTSATLAVDGRLDYFQQRMGAFGVRGVILDSPFDHARQMRLCLARGIPEPDTPGYVDQLPAWIVQSIDRTKGKALVLFTSSQLMRAMASAVAEDLERRGIHLLVQSAAEQRHALLQMFKKDVHSVLFGLESFWMGVDVPGEALEHVIITRLPFAVPNHPLIEARLELILQRGGNAFLEYTLPEAVLKFRQGVGRLIRSTTDTGLVTLLDARVLTKRYGRVFITSLPRSPVELVNAEGDVEVVSSEDWL